MNYLWLLLFPTASKILKYFDYFAERHPYSALFLPYCWIVPASIILHSVSLLQFISEGVRLLFVICIYVPGLMSLFFF